MHGDEAVMLDKAVRAEVALGWLEVKAILNKLRERGVPCMVPACDADSQLALLEREGIIWAVATVD